MTRKDFELVARVLRDYAAEHPAATDARDVLAVAFASEFAERNDRFDEARFRKACGS